MNVILIAELSEPPSDSLMFRHLTQIVKYQNFNVLVESPKDMIDSYFHYMKKRGIFDYIDDILPRPCYEDGIRLDTELNFPRTIVIKKIGFENIYNILGQIGVIRKF